MPTPTLAPKSCYLCVNQIDQLDYKNPQLLQRFVTPFAKIAPREKTGTCSRHQRRVTEMVKRARIMAFVPVTKK